MPGTHTVHLSPPLLSAFELVSTELHAVRLFSRLLRKGVAGCSNYSSCLNITPKTTAAGEKSLRALLEKLHELRLIGKLRSYDHLWAGHSGQKCGALWPASPRSSTSPVSVSTSDVAVLETWRLWLEGIWKCILRRQHSSYHSSRHRCWFKPFFDSMQQEKPFFVWASWVIFSYLPPRVLISSLFFFLGAYVPAACCFADRPSWRHRDPLPFLPIPPLPLSRNVRIILHFSLSPPLHIQSDILWQF